MPRRLGSFELAFGGIARLIGIEFRLRHTRVEDVERIETAVRTAGDEVAGAQLHAPLAALAPIFGIFSGGLSGLLAHAASLFFTIAQSGERQPPSCVPLARLLIY